MFINTRDSARFDLRRPTTRIVSESQDCRVIIFGFEPGQAVPAHFSSSTVLIAVLEGRGRFQVGEQERSVSAGDLAVCPPHTEHSLTADSDSRLVVLAVIAPKP